MRLRPGHSLVMIGALNPMSRRARCVTVGGRRRRSTGARFVWGRLVMAGAVAVCAAAPGPPAAAGPAPLRPKVLARDPNGVLAVGDHWALFVKGTTADGRPRVWRVDTGTGRKRSFTY